ncbi:uncharacterized protein LOC119777768 isoform X2 [Cyprinodon tularosa]|uniref:uncharacterized protein LOC119777768 isoform X2 n=1 Tax=Cyprinodon tularosa TaxID=77115 RepID=UPI0018E270D1|nr:uncharacterized protein LOC119777768 isoform X2 [Cyprinodon tularosa]
MSFRKIRAKHESEIHDTPMMNSASRKQMLDEAVLNFIVKDCQPLAVVENEGFRELLQLLEPSYVLPTRKTIKQLLAKKYEEERERAKMEVQQAADRMCLNSWKLK